MIRRKSDRFFLGIVFVLVFLGFLLLTSASLGLLARGNVSFSDVAFKQLFFGIFLGSIALIITSNINYRFWKKYSFYLFFASVIFSLFVFIPGLGLGHGGANRWINLGFVSMQPAEFLKLGFVIYFAAILSSLKSKIHTFKYGVLPSALILLLISAVLLSQPDTGTLLVIGITALIMFLAADGRWKHVGGALLISSAGLAVLAVTRPYVRERILTFLNPARDALGAGYQIQQSLIAIGSGRFTGRGFGQSIQKFTFLPEPIGDSIFAVAAEEFGFIGTVVIISLFLLLAFRGIYIAQKAPDRFGGLLVLGIIMLIIVQSFMNIGSMLGVIPLTGLPLLFISKGGTALFTTLLSIGIILNVSKYKKN